MEEKKTLREIFKTRRNQITTSDKLNKEQKIISSLQKSSLWQQATHIMMYMAFGSEPNLSALADEALIQAKKLYLPVVDKTKQCILPVETTSLKELKLSSFGIQEPNLKNYRKVNLENIELVLISGIAFDHKRYRLGYGAAYYDYFLTKLSKNSVSVGVAFAEQFVEKLPVQTHDIPMQYLLIENQWF